MSWLERNLDRLLTIGISVVLAGVIGFYSAILAMSKDIEEQNEKLAVLDTKIKDVVMPALTKLDAYNDRIYKLEVIIVKVDTQSEMIRMLWEHGIEWPRVQVKTGKQK